MIHPIIIWPFSKPNSIKHIHELIDFLILVQDRRMEIPAIIINFQSKSWMDENYFSVLEKVKNLNWTIRWIWSVDTCQTWLDAFGFFKSEALLKRTESKIVSNQKKQTFLLFPGDFHYSSPIGRTALSRIIDEFDNMLNPKYEIIIGELNSDPQDFKEIMDTYGTWKLLNIWFPEIKNKLKEIIGKPRSEFIALSDHFLTEQLFLKWFPYCQTLVFLIRLMAANNEDKIKVYKLGKIREDSPENFLKESITQIDRIERVLKVIWRENNRLGVNEYLRLSQLSQEAIKESIDEISKLNVE